MKDPAETVQAAHEFLDNIDWELIEEAADIGANVVEFVRQRPWMILAIGGALTGLGAWQMFQERGGGGGRRQTKQVTDLVRR